MSKVFYYMKRYYLWLIVAVVMLFIQAMCDLALPDYMSDIVNDGVMDGSISLIAKYGLKMIGVTLLGTVVSVFVGYLAANVAAKVSRNMRKDVYKKVELFSNTEYDKFSTASLITRTTNDITQIQNLLVMLIRMVFYAPILGVGGAVKALENSKELSWIIIVSLSAIVILIVFIFLVAMPKMTLMQKLVDKLNLVSRENIEGMLVTRAFNSQNFEFKRFDKANRDLKDTQVLKFNAYVGKYVESGEILGRVDGGPYIKSPSNGKFIEVDAERGDYVLTTDVMGYVANTYDMYIGANIEETDITKIKEGQSVKVTLDAYGSQKFEGIVTQVNSITNNALTGQTTSFSTSGTYTKTTQLISIKIKLVNSDIPLENIIGTNATVNIKVK